MNKIRKKYRVGMRFGSLTFKKDLRYRKGTFKCDCGTEKIITKGIVFSGQSRSCGCKKRELQIKKRLQNGYIYKETKHSGGYLVIFDKELKKRIFIHRKIMQNELIKYPNPSKMHIHHIDGNKKNNLKTNLLVLTPEEHFRIEKGWFFKENKWFKVCRGCEKEMEINNKNFYQRKTNRFLSRCKKCELLKIKERKNRTY